MHQFVTKQPHTQQASEMSAMCEHHFLAKQLLATGKQKNRMTNACLSSVLRKQRAPQRTELHRTSLNYCPSFTQPVTTHVAAN